MGNNQRRPLRFLNDVRHRKSLAAPGNPQQSLLNHALRNPGRQPRHRLRLVAGHLKIRSNGKVRHHRNPLPIKVIPDYTLKNRASPRTQARYKSIPPLLPA